MSRWSKLCSVTTLVGCAASGPAFESVSTLPDKPRYPAGAEVDPTSTLPESVPTGDTAQGLVVLEGPVDPKQARSTVDAFFRAMLEESPSALDLALAADAVAQAGSRREPARAYYLGRFLRLDYRSLRGEALYHAADVELWDRPSSLDLRGSPAPLEPVGNQVVIRVRITLPWAGRTRLFGDELVFRLAPHGQGFKILEILEDFNGT